MRALIKTPCVSNADVIQIYRGITKHADHSLAILNDFITWMYGKHPILITRVRLGISIIYSDVGRVYKISSVDFINKYVKIIV